MASKTYNSNRDTRKGFLALSPEELADLHGNPLRFGPISRTSRVRKRAPAVPLLISAFIWLESGVVIDVDCEHLPDLFRRASCELEEGDAGLDVPDCAARSVTPTLCSVM